MMKLTAVLIALLNPFFCNLGECSKRITPKVISRSLANWRTARLLNETETAPARTAILIIAPRSFGDGYVGQRWKLGKLVWEKYMNSHPDVDCYFMQCTHPRDDGVEVWLEGNTIYVGDEWSASKGLDRLLHKTIKSIEFLKPHYTHYFRTNINTFFNLDAVDRYAKSHHQSLYTTPLWQSAWYTIGYAALFSSDVAEHMVSEYNKLDSKQEELISPYHSDDAALTSLATGVWPYGRNPFTCSPNLVLGERQLMCESSLHSKRLSKYGLLLYPINSLEEALSYCRAISENVMLIRTRDDLTLDELKEYYDFLLGKYYFSSLGNDLTQ